MKEGHRQLRVGSRLMEEAELWAAQRGGTILTLTTGNPIAKRFYMKLGYLPRGLMGSTLEKSIGIKREEKAV